MIAVPKTLEQLCDPARTALLVYDMQVGIARQVDTADEVIRRCGNVIAAARAAGMRIVYTRHLSAPKSWMGTTQLRTAMAWQGVDDAEAVTPWFTRGAKGADILPQIAPQADDLVIDKMGMSAFEGTPLAFALHDCGLTGVAICGIALEIGIEPTIRHATDLGFVPILIEDACGYGNAGAAADAMRLIRFVGEAVVTDTLGFTAAIAQPEGSRG